LGAGVAPIGALGRPPQGGTCHSVLETQRFPTTQEEEEESLFKANEEEEEEEEEEGLFKDNAVN